MTGKTAASSLPRRDVKPWPLLSFAKNVVIGTLLSTNPFTGVIVLGWFVRRMRAVTVPGAEWPQWLTAPGDAGLRRWLGGLAANTREGASAGSALFIATLPFTGLWALGWWAGWNNSFAKGYEDAAFGPLLSLTAVVLALPIIAALPMALAHRAADGRWHSLFQLHSIASLIARVPIRYAGLLLLWSVFGLVFLFFRVLPLGAETIWPGLASLEGEAVAGVRGQITVVHALLIFLSLLVLRGLSARLYGLANSRLSERRAHGVFVALGWVMMLAASFAVVAQIYVAQFLNYKAWVWLSHPLLVLPGIP